MRSRKMNEHCPTGCSSPCVSRGETALIGLRSLPGDHVGRDHGKPSAELGDPLSKSKGGGIGPPASVDLPIKIRDVTFHRVDGQREAMGDLGIRLALRDEAEDIKLTRGESMRVPRRWRRRPFGPTVRTAFDNEAGDRADDLVGVLEEQGRRASGKQAEMTVRQRRGELLRDRSRDLLDVGAVKNKRGAVTAARSPETSIALAAWNVARATAGVVAFRNDAAARRPASPTDQPIQAWAADSTKTLQSRSMRRSNACVSGALIASQRREGPPNSPRRVTRP